MIYFSKSIVIHADKDKVWETLKGSITHLHDFTEEVTESEIIETNDQHIIRKNKFKDGDLLVEKVFIVEHTHKVINKLIDHPFYFGDTIFQIITSKKESLSHRKTTLTAVLAWSIHPGIIEAPKINKEDFIAGLLHGYKEKIEVIL